jgi:hypothetical protein
MTGESMIREKKGGETGREGVKEKKNKEEKGGGEEKGGKVKIRLNTILSRISLL